MRKSLEALACLIPGKFCHTGKSYSSIHILKYIKKGKYENTIISLDVAKSLLANFCHARKSKEESS